MAPCLNENGEIDVTKNNKQGSITSKFGHLQVVKREN